MIEQDHHFHARTSYKPISEEDIDNLLNDLKEAKKLGGKSLTVHLPFEVQHPEFFRDLTRGLLFIIEGETLKRLEDFPLYWENAPEQVYGEWTLKSEQTDWTLIPRDIDLCLDTGHLMLGAKDYTEARERIEKVLFDRELQIKHLHIHENDLVHDNHDPLGGRIITDDLFSRLTRGRTYIFERPIPDAQAVKP